MKTTLNFIKIKIALLITAIVFSISSFAQAPNKMSYQAVIRDASNNLVANQSVGVRISILKGSASGSSVFVETHSATTNANGLVSVEIGNGTNVSGSISGINWGTDAYFIKTETDPTGGTSYSISATNQLLSVPYALSSEKASDMELLDLNDVTGNPTAGQVLKWDGTTWKPQNDLTGGTGGSYSAGSGITISGSNVISADLGTDIATSEIQNNAVTTAKIANDAITAPKIDDMGATSGQVMQYNGTNWAPATPATGSTYTAGSGIAISGSNAISATLGTDISTAEIQNNAVTTAKIATNAVTANELANNAVTNPKLANNAVNTVNIANDAVTAPKIAQMSATSGEVLKWNGSAWAPAADNTGSASYTAGSGIAISGSNAISATLGTDISTAEIQNNAVTTAKIATNAVTGNEIANNAVNTAQLANDAVTAPKIDDMGATSGQILQYNGTNWAPTTPAATTSPWTVSGSDVYRNTGRVGIGITSPVNTLSVLQPIGNANSVRIESSDHPSGKDLLELIVPITASDASQFIEFQKGSSIVAAIDADGSAKFKDIEFDDNTVQTTAAIGPIAYGSIASNSSIGSGSGGYTVSYDGSNNRYEITITGENYFYLNYTTMVTPESSTVRAFRTSSSGGKLLIYLYNSAGIPIQGNFNFIVYK